MSRYNSVLYNWTEITNRLLKNKQELAQFLRFSAGMYKQSFSDAALIYHQNPNATKVATLETWNRLGRLVNRGEHSIAVFGEDCKCCHMFDITQTNGKRIPSLWKLTPDLSAELTEVINRKYGADCKTIQETIAAVSVDNLKCRLTDMQYITGQMQLSEDEVKAYQQSVVSAVRFMVSCRCELDSNMKISGGLNLNAADKFRDTRDLIYFCDLVQKSAKDSLLELEHEVIQILKKRREQTHELQAQPDRAVSDRNAVHGQPEGTGIAAKADRQMGQDVADVDEIGIPGRGSGTRHDGAMEHRTTGDRPTGGETLVGAGRTIPAGESPSDGFPADAGVGENPSADARTQDHGGHRIPDEELTIENLKQRFLHADFNRRLDSYAAAGHVFKNTEDTNIDPVAFFNRFEADRYSPVQAEEIRSIIEAAIRNRDKMLAAPEETVTPTEPEQTTETEPVQSAEPQTITEPEPPEQEPVIVNNFPLIRGTLPPLTDESLIAGILTHDQFYAKKCGEIAAFFAENENPEERAAFVETAFNTEYSEMDIGAVRVGYKTADNGLMIWEGSTYLSRTKECGLTWDMVQSMIAKLIEEGKYLTEPAVTKSTPASTNNRLIIYSFSETDGNITADCSMGGKEFSAPILRTDQDVPYINHNGKPVKLNDVQAYDLEQFELYHAPITHDANGYYADNLEAGDTIWLDGEEWTVVTKNDYSIRLSNKEKEHPDNVQNIYGHWQEKLTKMGFEFIPEGREIETPIFSEPPKPEMTPEPEEGEMQLTLFGEPVPIEKVGKKARTVKPKKIAAPEYPIEQEMIDFALKCGSNEPKSLERIVAQFQKGKTTSENAEFLRREFGTNGRGYRYCSAAHDHSALVAGWFDKNGMTLERVYTS